MKHSLHPRAEDDLASIIERYLSRFGLRAARRFLDEYARVVRLIEENPELGTKTTRGRRKYPLREVPYLVVYRADEAGLRILIVRHQHRNPRYGTGRR